MRRQHFLICATFASLAFFGDLTSAQDENPGFNASGRLVVTTYDAKGAEYTNHHSQFEIDVSGQQWKMVSRLDTGHSFRVGSDGSAVFAVVSYPPHMKMPTNGVPPATIDAGGYYLSGTPYQNIIWYALSSSVQTNGLFPAPWLSARMDPTAETLVSIVKRKLDSGLPAEAQFHFAKSKVGEALKSENLPQERQNKVVKQFSDALNAYKDGFLVADYQVFQTTNVNGLTVPTHFILRRFSPDYDAGKVFETFEGHVHGLSSSVITNFLPEDTGIVGVQDYRFKNTKDRVDGIRYVTSNLWISANDSNLAMVYQKKLANRPRHITDRENRKAVPVLIALLFITISLPVVIMTRKWKAKRQVGA